MEKHEKDILNRINVMDYETFPSGKKIYEFFMYRSLMEIDPYTALVEKDKKNISEILHKVREESLRKGALALIIDRTPEGEEGNLSGKADYVIELCDIEGKIKAGVKKKPESRIEMDLAYLKKPKPRKI